MKDEESTRITEQSVEHSSVYNEVKIKYNISPIITLLLIQPTGTSQKY